MGHYATTGLPTLNIWVADQGATGVWGNELVTFIRDKNEPTNIFYFGERITLDNNSGLLDDQWHTYTLTVDTTNPDTNSRGAKIYIDGIAQSATTRGNDGYDSPTGPTLIGASDPDEDPSTPDRDQYLEDHQMRELRVYGSVNTPSDSSQPIVEYSTATVDLKYTDINKPPVFQSPANSINILENSAAQVMNSNITLSDPDYPTRDFNGATLKLARTGGPHQDDTYSLQNSTGLVEGEALIHNGLAVGTVTENNLGTLLITFDSNLTDASLNSVARSLMYANTSESPPANVEVSWQFGDGFSGPVEQGIEQFVSTTTTINIQSLPDFTISSPASVQVLEDSTLSLTGLSISHDDTPPTIFNAVVSVNNGSLTVPNPPIGTLIINGNSSHNIQLQGIQAEIQQALNSISYLANTHFNGTDTLTLSARNISGNDEVTQTTLITVTSVNDFPVIIKTDNSANLFFTEAYGVPIKLLSQFSIDDPEINNSGKYTDSTLTVNRTASSGNSPDAQLAFSPLDIFSTADNPLIEGSDIPAGATTFATIVKNSNGILTIRFNEFATSSLIGTLVQNIQYQHGGNWPPDTVTLRWIFNDNGISDAGLPNVLPSLDSATDTDTQIFINPTTSRLPLTHTH